MDPLFDFGYSQSLRRGDLDGVKKAILSIPFNGFLNVYGIYDDYHEAVDKLGILRAYVKSFLSDQTDRPYSIQSGGGDFRKTQSFIFCRVIASGTSQDTNERLNHRLGQVLSIAKVASSKEGTTTSVIEEKAADVDLIFSLVGESFDIKAKGKPFHPHKKPSSAYDDCSVFVLLK